MAKRMAVLFLAAASWLGVETRATADTVQLVNGDALHGKVVSLNETQLVFRSESFGELKIERAKVDLIALGNKPLPSARQVAEPAPASSGNGSLFGQVAPILQSPTAQQTLGPMVEQLLGAGGVGDLQKNVDTARKGLQDLKKDFGNGPESQALDAYINVLNLFGALSPSPPQRSRAVTPPPAKPLPSPPAVKPPANIQKP
jgi:hypothetical protein